MTTTEGKLLLAMPFRIFRGTLNPLNSATLNGSAGATFTPPVSGKTLSACAKVDNALVCVDITKADVMFLPIIFQ